MAIYLEAGDYVDRDPVVTIRNLGNLVCRTISKLTPHLGQIPAPQFDAGIANLSGFLDSVFELEPALKLIIILDEFDELPLGLYEGNLGHAFFLTLRSLSGKNRLGFILVGGE